MPFGGKSDVSNFSQSPLIKSLSNLQVKSTGIKARTNSNLGRIGLKATLFISKSRGPDKILRVISSLR